MSDEDKAKETADRYDSYVKGRADAERDNREPSDKVALFLWGDGNFKPNDSPDKAAYEEGWERGKKEK